EDMFDSAAKAVSEMAVQVNASFIIVLTNHGRLPSLISKYRPKTTVIALSDNFETMNVLRLVWGVLPLYFDSLNLINQNEKDEMKSIKPAIKFLKEQNIISSGQCLVFTSGNPVDEKNASVWIKILSV